MRRAKTKNSKIGCVRCLLHELPCHTGTLKGSCIACGGMTLIDFAASFDGFFNKDLEAQMLLLVREPEYALFNSDDEVLEINITTSNGLSDSHTLLTRREFLPSNCHLKYQLDQMVWLYYIPNIRCKTAKTSLITSALFGRGYLSLLCPCDVTEEAETISSGIRLFNLILTRLEESISEVVNGFSKEKLSDDDWYWSEASASLGILYPGLVHAQGGLKDGTIQPLCGDTKLANLLTERIKSTLMHLNLLLLHRGLSCDLGWTSILTGPLEDLRSTMKISSLSVRTMKQSGLLSRRSLSTASSGSTSISDISTPLSIDLPILRNPSTTNSSTPHCAGYLDTGPKLSSTATKLSTPRSTQFQVSDLSYLTPPSSTTNVKQKFFSPPPTFLYGDTSTICEPSSGIGFSNLMLSESLPNLQVLGMFCNAPREIEQNPSHVSGPLSDASDTREETSVLASRDLFPDMQIYLRGTFIG